MKFVITREEFIERVEAIVARDDLTYLEAIIALAFELEIEPEDFAPLIKDNSNLLSKLKRERACSESSQNTLVDWLK